MRKLFFIILFISVLPIFAEECKEPQNLELNITNNKILVGDIVNYEISFKVDEKSNLYLKELSLEPFELVKKSGKKEKTKSGNYYQKFNLKLSIYETGEQVIPSFDIVSVTDDKQSCYKIPEKKIVVSSILKDEKKDGGIKDIKETVEVKEKTYAILWVAGFLILAILLFFIYRYFKYKTSIDEKEIIIKEIDPVDLAYKKLSKLTKDNLLRDNLIKEYYFRLSEIIREYLGGIYKFDSVEMTTDELKDKIDSIPDFKRAYTDLIKNFLDDTDFVKFAKFKPTSQEVGQATEVAFDIIEKLKPSDRVGER